MDGPLKVHPQGSINQPCFCGGNWDSWPINCVLETSSLGQPQGFHHPRRHLSSWEEAASRAGTLVLGHRPINWSSHPWTPHLLSFLKVLKDFFLLTLVHRSWSRRVPLIIQTIFVQHFFLKKSFFKMSLGGVSIKVEITTHTPYLTPSKHGPGVMPGAIACLSLFSRSS